MIKSVKKHLSVLIMPFIVFIILMIGFLIFSKKILIFITEYIGLSLSQLHIFDPVQALIIYLKLAFTLALPLVIPLLIIVIYNSLKDELKTNLGNKIYKYLTISYLLMFAGLAYGFLIYSKYALIFLLDINIFTATLSAKKVLNLVTYSSVSFAIIIQLIIILPLLINKGILNKKKLSSIGVRFSIISSSILFAGILTPSDLFSLAIMAIPIYSFYEIGLLFSKNKEDEKNVKHT